MIHITQAGRSTPNIAVISEACNDYFDQLQAKDQREGHWIFITHAKMTERQNCELSFKQQIVMMAVTPVNRLLTR